jgi:hypothetical protein
MIGVGEAMSWRGGRKMAMLITYEGPDVKRVVEEIAGRCSVPAKAATGLCFGYDKESKTIFHSEISEDVIDVFAVVSEEKEKITVAVPLGVSRSLSFFNPGPPRHHPTLEPKFNGKLRDYQESGALRVIEKLRDTGMCYMRAPPGYGKTVIMSWVIASLKERTLILVPNLGLAEQTKVSVTSMLPGLRVQILDVDSVIDPGTDVLISFIRRIQIPAGQLASFKTVIFDEVHLLTTKVGIACMLTTRPNHLLALTATPGERNAITELFVGECAIKEMEDLEWSICFPRVRSDLRCEYKGRDGYTTAMGDLCSSEVFVNSVMRMMVYFVSTGERVIVLTMRRDMSTRIARLLEETCYMLPPSKVEIPISYAVLTPEERKCRNCDVIIGTYGLIGTGFDLRNYVENFDGRHAGVMMFIGSIKDPTLMYQAAGRSFRSQNPLAVYPVVTDLPISIKHSKSLIKKVSEHIGCKIRHDTAELLESIAFDEDFPIDTPPDELLTEDEEIEEPPTEDDEPTNNTQTQR